MEHIIRYSPFSDLMDEMLKNFMTSQLVRSFDDDAGMQISTDLSGDDKVYTLKEEIPGVKNEDIHVTVAGNHVSISAEASNETGGKERSRVIRSERHYGKIYRSMILGTEVDLGAADASYADGVLTLTLPREPQVGKPGGWQSSDSTSVWVVLTGENHILQGRYRAHT